MLGPLLTGVDDRPSSRDAVELAAGLCEQAGAGLIAANVPQGEYPFTPFDQPYQQELLAYLRALRHDLMPALERVPDGRRREIRAYHAVTPAGGLQELAASERARLIVVGSSHHSPVGQVLIGSTAAKLLPHAFCPVAVAPRGYSEAPARRLRRVGVALDGCRSSEFALARARDLAGDLDAELIALSVATSHGVAPSPPGIERLVLEGPTVQALGRASADLDVLVVGCRETGGVAGHPTLTSVSRRLLHTATCPLVVVPESLGSPSPSATRGSEAAPA